MTWIKRCHELRKRNIFSFSNVIEPILQNNSDTLFMTAKEINNSSILRLNNAKCVRNATAVIVSV